MGLEERRQHGGAEGGSKVSGTAEGGSTVLKALNTSTQELLEKCKTLLQQSEKEREAFLATLHDLGLSHKETHWLDWNINFLESELRKVGKDKKELNDKLTHEVTRGVYLKDEVRRLEAQNVEDRMRIQRLLALSQPVQHDITFTARPVDFGRGGASHLEPWEEDVEDWVQKMLGTEKDPNVIEQLKAIKELYEDIEIAKKSYQDEVVRLQTQRSKREIQAERSLRDVLKRLGEAGDTLRKEESDLEEATRQYLQLICDSQAYKNEYLDEQASLVQGRRALLEESARFSERLSREADKRRLTNEKESGASVRHLQSQLDGLESEVCLIVEQYRAEKPLLDKRIEDLEKKLTVAKKEYRKEHVQSRLDQEGYETDVRALNEQWGRAKRLESTLLASSSSTRGGREEVSGRRGGLLEDSGLQELMWRLEVFSKERQMGLGKGGKVK